MKKNITVSFIILTLTSLLLLSACQNNPVTPTNPDAVISATPEGLNATLLPTLPEPTSTTAPKTVFFITNAIENNSGVNTISDYLIEYSNTNGFIYQSFPSQTEISPQADDLVIVFENDTIKFDAASVQPNVTYIIYTLNDQPVSSDVFQIKQRPAEQVFLAGYISALVADDWRIGGILPNLSQSNTSFEQIFKNGAHYLCGRCTPVYAPVIPFPVTGAVDSSTSSFDVYSQLETDRINVLYIPTGFLTNELYAALRENKRIIISDSPPKQTTEQLADMYVYQDYISPLNEILMDQKNPEKTDLTAKLIVQDLTNRLSVGKINFISNIITNLETGFLSPFTVIEN